MSDWEQAVYGGRDRALVDGIEQNEIVENHHQSQTDCRELIKTKVESRRVDAVTKTMVDVGVVGELKSKVWARPETGSDVDSWLIS